MRTESTAAQNNPVHRPGKEIHTGDMKTREVPDVVLSNATIEREPEEIVLVDSKQKIDADYAKALDFMEEVLTIRLERSREKFAPAILDFYVNGKAIWIPVGRPCKVARKYVEVIARAQPYDVRTNVVKHEEREENRVERHTITQHPFSVVHDPSGERGAEWLTRVMLES